MLELLVSLRRTRGEGAIGGAEKPDKKVGDVICAKPSPAIWSWKEHRDFLIVEYEDAALEEKVLVNDGVVSLPFAKTDGEGKVITRSERKIDVSAFVGRTSIALDKISEAPTQTIQCLQESEII